MEIKISKYAALLAGLLTLASCAQEGPEAPGPKEMGNRIFFRSHLPGVTQTRAEVISNDNLSECRVTCIIPEDTVLIDPESGKMTPYFRDMRFEKDDEGRFVALESDTSMWPKTKNILHFFAYHPSVEEMRKAINVKKFNLANYSRSTDSNTIIDYRLENFQVAAEIADQVDFIAAYSDGTQQANGSTGIELNFGHRLARIELMAWSKNIRYDIEIAGVRIGNAITQGDFNFSSLISSTDRAGDWLNTVGHQSVVEHIFGEGETIVHLSNKAESHTDKAHSASIMGTAGPAMVIPMADRIEAWGGKDDVDSDTDSYSTDKLYFSVLLRVKNVADEVVYPYPRNSVNIPVTYLAVGNDGTVIRRLYKFDGEYYTSPEKQEDHIYVGNDTEEIRGFCWAALPVAAKWDPGKIYSYKLNYTNGIGLHDPHDPIPGEPIFSDNVTIDVTVADWKEGESNNVTVPRK